MSKHRLPDCTNPACPHPKPHGHLSMADRVPNGEPMNDAIAAAQAAQRAEREAEPRFAANQVITYTHPGTGRACDGIVRQYLYGHGCYEVNLRPFDGTEIIWTAGEHLAEGWSS